MKRALDYSGYLIGTIVYIAINVILFRMEYISYTEKINILCEVAEAEERGEEIFPIITELLKGSGTGTEKESDKLMEYGYQKEYINAFKRQMYRSCVQILALTTLTAAILWILRSRERKRRNEAEAERLEQIDRQMQQLRDGSYVKATEYFGGEGEALLRLNMNLVSLAEQIKLVTDNARKEKEETKGLVTNLSHQLKTPVAALKASFEILSNPDLTPSEREEFSARCTEQIARLEELVGALVQISRMETGIIEVQLEDKPILDTIRMAVNRIYVQAQEKAIEISMEVQKEDEGLRLMQDTKWLSEAFINILENAIKYSENETHIRIRLEKRTSFLRLEIEDEGIGVPRAERSQIFKRF